jgi:lysyl endopeptidase
MKIRISVFKFVLSAMLGWFILGSSPQVIAQISFGGQPLEIPSFKSTDKLLISAFVLNIDPSKIEEFDKHSLTDFKTFRFAYPVEVHLNMQNSGSWGEFDGHRIWNLRISSPGALSLNLIFSEFEIPDGARLFLFNADKTIVRGAYTSQNRHRLGGFSIFPIETDELILQYEEPIGIQQRGCIEIRQIAHGYKSLMAKGNERRPLGLSGSCNVNIHCDTNSPLDKQARSVCRILTKGIEYSTGTLINNTMNDGTPYLLGAYHAFDSLVVAQTAVFQFLYESPGCYDVDGDNSFTLSGSTAVAWSDSADFILLRLDKVPPPSFRPYYSGWDASKTRPLNSYTLHHPKADVKKISYDKDICDSMSYNVRMFSNGFWRVANWEIGTTEAGSSGGALFSQNQRIVGTLTGGSAACDKPEADYFARFDYQYNKSNNIEKQLKHWLNPNNTSAISIDGFDPYLNSDLLCSVRSNFRVFDQPQTVATETGSKSVFTGNNSIGIIEFAEYFSNDSRVYVEGISLGVGKVAATNSQSKATIRMYSGQNFPTILLSETQVNFRKLTKSAMNYIPFDQAVLVEGSFFISVLVPEAEDTLQIFQSKVRDNSVPNTLYFKQNSDWKPASDFFSGTSNSASLLMQVLFCGDILPSGVDTLDHDSERLKVYPNPSNGFVTIEYPTLVNEADIYIYDLLGKLVMVDRIENMRGKQLDLTSLIPGVYLVKSDFYGVAQRFKLIVH